MSAFPTLRTGAVAQYPLDLAVRFQTQSVKFMDGSQQRFRLYGSGLRRWKIRLDLLDEQELAAVAAFLEQPESKTPIDSVIFGEQDTQRAAGRFFDWHWFNRNNSRSIGRMA